MADASTTRLGCITSGRATSLSGSGMRSRIQSWRTRRHRSNATSSWKRGKAADVSERRWKPAIPPQAEACEALEPADRSHDTPTSCPPTCCGEVAFIWTFAPGKGDEHLSLSRRQAACLKIFFFTSTGIHSGQPMFLRLSLERLRACDGSDQGESRWRRLSAPATAYGHWPDGFFGPAAQRGYCIGAPRSSGGGNGLNACGAGGRYPSDECGLRVL